MRRFHWRKREYDLKTLSKGDHQSKSSHPEEGEGGANKRHWKQTNRKDNPDDWEFHTGAEDNLFDPEKDKHHSTDFHHIYWIMELLGDVPKRLITKSHNSKDFFHSSGKFKVKKPDHHPLSIIFKDDVEVVVNYLRNEK